MSSGNSSKDEESPRMTVVVARHGERQDYVTRDDAAGGNWVAANLTNRPFDPPLTEHGKEQAEKLGRHLYRELSRLDLPPVTAVYTSPFLRCRQTAVSALKGILQEEEEEQMSATDSTAAAPTKVRIEMGLAESINEQWYRSWALPGADGTWGFQINGSKEFDPETLHPLSKQFIQNLLRMPSSDNDNKTNGDDDELLVDWTYTSQTTIDKPYTFYPQNLETRQEQRTRMKQVLDTLLATTSSGNNETVLLVSHGGPVTHLFEELTGQPWHVHGTSTYCCYSIYQYCNGNNKWQPVQVNQSDFLHEKLHGDAYVD